ncbi:hypothetical protein LP414_33170 [Polaromonas sp. P1(28)-13]|nr:hypothetical protein LP414_33170 [Polaromonas sp. P1(28)-13]
MELLIKRMQAEPEIGICGNTITYHDNLNTVQAYGGTMYSMLTGRGRAYGAGTLLDKAMPNTKVEANINYISGASMFVRCSQVLKIGLMCEDYFLYNEEIDWALRGRKSFRLGVETAAVVSHKEGASIGTESQGKRGSPLSSFFQARSKLLFAWRYTPYFYPVVWLALFARFCKQVIATDRASAFVILQVLFGRRHPSPEWFSLQGRIRLMPPVSVMNGNESPKPRVRKILWMMIFLTLSFSVFRYFPGLQITFDAWVVLMALVFPVLIAHKLLNPRRRFTNTDKYSLAILVIIPPLAAFSSWWVFGQPLMYGLVAQRNILLVG